LLLFQHLPLKQVQGLGQLQGTRIEQGPEEGLSRDGTASAKVLRQECGGLNELLGTEVAAGMGRAGDEDGEVRDGWKLCERGRTCRLHKPL
jgi:hypothetical protein